jgi:hypothetical protein
VDLSEAHLMVALSVVHLMEDLSEDHLDLRTDLSLAETLELPKDPSKEDLLEDLVALAERLPVLSEVYLPALSAEHLPVLSVVHHSADLHRLVALHHSVVLHRSVVPLAV